MNFEGLEYLQIMLAPLAPILLVVGAVVVVWLILRPIRMWYWKVDKQRLELENVNRQLTEIRTALEDKDSAAAMPEVAEEAGTPQTELWAENQEIQNVQDEDVKIIEILTGEVQEENFAEPQKRRKLGIRDYATDRKGRTYTQEEIEAQIRD